MAETFLRPRYLLGFTEEASQELTSKVKAWIQQAGLHVDVDGQAARELGRPAFLVVSAGREQLEAVAEQLCYVKAHHALAPHVDDQGLGKIEFEWGSKEWVASYENYDSPEFWRPCERVQLLRALLEQIPADQLKDAKVGNKVALSVTGSLVAALRIAGWLETMVPMNDDMSRACTSICKAGVFSIVAPADQVQQYFGSYVAMYFAWMNSFTCWLLAPAGVGLACWWHMRTFGYTVDDHPYLPFHSLFVVLWSVAFLCNWDRFCAGKAWQWNVHGVERKEEIRAEFRGELRTSRATGLPERFYPYLHRLLAYSLSVVVTSLMLLIAFFVMICSLNLQGYMEEHVTTFERAFYAAPLARWAHPGALFDPNQTEYFGLLAFGPTVLHVLAIMQLNKLYRSVAQWLTENENHRLLEDHENSLIAKRFLFEAFDCYISLFYVGFVQQDMRKLRNELVSLYTVDILRRVFTETVIPLVMRQVSKRKLARQEEELKRRDQAHYVEALEVLEQAEYEQFDDFLEMVIEFGYVTLFAAAFPLASVLSIASNFVEMKSDLFKLTMVYQRPISLRAAGIGIWRTVLQVLVAVSIMTNVMIFSMSEQLASWAPWLYREARAHDVELGRLAKAMDETAGTADLVMKKGSGFYIVLTAFSIEHIIGLIALVLVTAIPRQPDWVSDEVGRTAWFKRTRAKKETAGQVPSQE